MLNTSHRFVSARRALAPLLLVAATLSGCDYLGIESGAQIAAQKEAEGKAVGAACRQVGRAIEECYKLNPKSIKAAVFEGWREMDGYMRDNNISNLPIPVEAPKPAAPKEDEAGGDTSGQAPARN
jgi:hypothetical protein